MSSQTKATVEHLNPEGLHHNPAYSQAVVVTGPARTIYVGRQDAVDAAGKLVGKGDVVAQTEQILRNVETALAAASAALHHVIKFNIYVVQGQNIQPAYEVFQRMWGRHPNPPLVTMAFVAALAHPDFLAEIDAIAVVPEG